MGSKPRKKPKKVTLEAYGGLRLMEMKAIQEMIDEQDRKFWEMVGD
jgi:hypothetical protein